MSFPLGRLIAENEEKIIEIKNDRKRKKKVSYVGAN